MCEKDLLVTEPPEDGCYVYGFFLEGAKFDFDKMALADSDPRVLFTKCPMIYFKPMDKAEISYEGQNYGCPCYRTSERKGNLLTTGHSTNFVTMLRIPIVDDMRHWVKRGVAALINLTD